MLLKSNSHLPKNYFYWLQWKAFKSDEKCFLIHVKSSFRSWDVYIFALTFWSCRKTTRKLWLISTFMMSQTEQQFITIHILPNISRSKSNQTINFGQLLEYNMRNNFLEKSFTKGGRESSPRPFKEKSKLSIFLDQQFEML